jgi:CRP-like cAMP-binding protein
MSLKDIFPIDRWDFDSQSILKDLPKEDFERLTANATEKSYIKGETVFKEGSVPYGIHYILKGKVKKFKVDNFGKEQIIYVGNARELIGYHAILAEENYPDSAVTLEASEIVFIPKKDFLEVLDRSAVFTRRLLKTLSREFGVLANNISVFAKRPVRERLAITLLVLREKFKNEALAGHPVELNVSRDDLANMAGATRESIVRLLREYKDENLITTKGRTITITDVKGLIAASNYI